MTTLPYAEVDCSLKALAGRAEGFGRFAVGGLHGDLYVVTSLAGDAFANTVSLYNKNGYVDASLPTNHTGKFTTKLMHDSSFDFAFESDCDVVLEDL